MAGDLVPLYGDASSPPVNTTPAKTDSVLGTDDPGGTPATNNFPFENIIEDVAYDRRVYSEVSAPATPAAGTIVVYGKSDGKLYYKDDTGAETEIGSGVTTGKAIAMAIVFGG